MKVRLRKHKMFKMRCPDRSDSQNDYLNDKKAVCEDWV